MTPFEYFVSMGIAIASGVFAIETDVRWARMVSVVTLFGITYFAGIKGGVLL